MMRRAALLLLAATTAGCTADASAEYAALALGTADPVPNTQCVPLPLSPGAKIIEDLSLGAGISAHVVATPDAIDVTLGGTTTPEHRVLSHDKVYDGYAERLIVQTPDAVMHTVIFVSPCDVD